jgi:hypothetical protein
MIVLFFSNQPYFMIFDQVQTICVYLKSKANHTLTSPSLKNIKRFGFDYFQRRELGVASYQSILMGLYQEGIRMRRSSTWKLLRGAKNYSRS